MYVRLLVRHFRRRDLSRRPTVEQHFPQGQRGQVRDGASTARVKLCLAFENRQVLLMEGANIIGRAPDATIQIDSPGVSRYHARIVVSKGEATVEDLGSKNGTRVTGELITTPAHLSDGSEILLGAVVLTFRIAPPMSPTETVPAGDG